jgi:hypothetical protein
MKVTFNTTDYGKIECNSDTKLAYFCKDDLETTIQINGNFYHPYTGLQFYIQWPFTNLGSAILFATITKEISRTKSKLT